MSHDYDAIHGVHLHLVPKEESDDATTSYITIRHGAISTLIGAITQEPGSINRVTIYELTIQKPPMEDWFATLRVPM